MKHYEAHFRNGLVFVLLAVDPMAAQSMVNSMIAAGMLPNQYFKLIQIGL